MRALGRERGEKEKGGESKRAPLTLAERNDSNSKSQGLDIGETSKESGESRLTACK